MIAKATNFDNWPKRKYDHIKVLSMARALSPTTAKREINDETSTSRDCTSDTSNEEQS